MIDQKNNRHSNRISKPCQKIIIMKQTRVVRKYSQVSLFLFEIQLFQIIHVFKLVLQCERKYRLQSEVKHTCGILRVLSTSGDGLKSVLASQISVDETRFIHVIYFLSECHLDKPSCTSITLGSFAISFALFTSATVKHNQVMNVFWLTWVEKKSSRHITSRRNKS